MFVPRRVRTLSLLRVGKAFSLVELLVSLAVIAVLAAILIPTVGRVRAQSISSKCQSNLRQLVVSALVYQTDNGGRFLKSYDTQESISWYRVLRGGGDRTSYIGDIDWVCPGYEADDSSDFPGYGMTSLVLWYPQLERTDQRSTFFSQQLTEPSGWPLFMDADFISIYSLDSPTAAQTPSGRYSARHSGMANVAMVDGHIESVPYGDTRWRQSMLNNGTYYMR